MLYTTQLEDAGDLRDGLVFMELVSFVEDGASIPAAESSGSDEGYV
jgi:hypothetical protein